MSLQHLHPAVWDDLCTRGSPDTGRMIQLLETYLGQTDGLPRQGRLLLQYITEHAKEIDAWIQQGRPSRAKVSEVVSEESTQHLETGGTDVDTWDMIPISNDAASSPPSRTINTTNTPTTIREAPSPAAADSTGTDLLEPLIDRPDADQCGVSLQSEAMERLKTVVQTSYKTDAGLIILENDLAFFYDLDSNSQNSAKYTEQIVAWVAEMKRNWKDRIHSTVWGEFEEALELWTLTAPKTMYNSF